MLSDFRYCSECNKKTVSGDSYGRAYCRECGSFYEPKLLAKRKEMIAEIRKWHDGEIENFPPITVFESIGFLIDELDRLEREYAEERAAHNAHVTELLVKDAKLNQAVEALEWIVECGTDYQSINKARNALCEIKGGESDE